MGDRLIIAIVALLASCGLNGVIVALCCEFGRLARESICSGSEGSVMALNDPRLSVRNLLVRGLCWALFCP